MTDRQWFIEQYDAIVKNSGDDGSEVDKTKDAVAHVYADGVETAEIERWATDLVAEGRALFDQMVKPERDRRRNEMRKSVEYLLDTLADGTILGVNDPKLDLSYAVGDGRDKTLRLWTQDDWQSSTTARYRNAAQVTRAASTFDDGATKIIRAMQARDVRKTGDLFR